MTESSRLAEEYLEARVELVSHAMRGEPIDDRIAALVVIEAELEKRLGFEICERLKDLGLATVRQVHGGIVPTAVPNINRDPLVIVSADIHREELVKEYRKRGVYPRGDCKLLADKVRQVVAERQSAIFDRFEKGDGPIREALHQRYPPARQANPAAHPRGSVFPPQPAPSTGPGEGNSGSEPMRYAGVWREGTTYRVGEVVTHRGVLWHVNQETDARPGTGPAMTMMLKNEEHR